MTKYWIKLISGIALIAIPFIGMIVTFIYVYGWRKTLIIWGVSLLASGMIFAGTYLIVYRD